MYIPKLFNVTDFNEVKQFIDEHSFGIVVSQTDEGPVATHTPMLLRKMNNQYVLTGHMAKVNSQWLSFQHDTQKVLAIFQGPHTYVSSSWYENENVPTWNYQVVHIYGTVQTMTKAELANDLAILLEKYEMGRENPVLWETLSEETKEQMKAIVGFKIIIEDIQAAYKLSQNRNQRDYEQIIQKLSQGDEQAQKIAEAMKKIRKH